MDIDEVRKALREGVTPSPDYPDLPNDFTAAELIAYDPKAELEYRMAKDRHPELTRAAFMRAWRPFRIGRLWVKEKTPSQKEETGLLSILRGLFGRGRGI